ncbi:MAG TPA: carboxymuconolactone decarboxylase family protein [Rectinemataceae bacterium]|nr:carboxymuconolactone decarboxylase family protein [Rectinemataceae bacterium]
MNLKERFEAMKKAGMEIQRPMELLGALDEKAALAHLDGRAAVFAEGSLPMKYKTLVALGAAVALDSPMCIQNNVKSAKQAGATNAEIMEAIAVAKFSKSSTVVSNSAQALEWLLSQPK